MDAVAVEGLSDIRDRQMGDHTPSQRIVRLLLRLLRQPYRYTRRELEEAYGISENTFLRDVQVLRAAGVDVQVDGLHRYAVLPEASVPELARFQALTDVERARLREAVGRAFGKAGEAAAIERKLTSLYDFQQLGLRALRRPELAKVDALESAKEQRVAVRLIDYRSTNSNETNDRLVEAFSVDTANGIVHAFDLARGALRHFRLDRFARVEILETESWAHVAQHKLEPTDCFRIVDPQQVRVHLEMSVRAYNDLVERYPASLTHLSAAAEADRHDFEGPVNHRFLGLAPFCLGMAGEVDVVQPLELREVLAERAERFVK